MKKRRALLLILLTLLLLVGIPTGLMLREYQQEQRDNTLITAILSRDTARALAALDAGANANARRGDKPPTFQGSFHHLLDSLLHRRVRSHGAYHEPALLLVFYNSRGIPNTPALIQSLLEHGADSNCKGEFGFTPLRLAVSQGNAPALRSLLAHGANPNEADAGGRTPLHFAHSVEFIHLLVTYGADVNAQDHKQITPLMNVAERNHPEQLQVLLEYGADIHARDKSLMTPLIYAARHSSLNNMRMLIQKGADINAQTVDGMTSLMVPMDVSCVQLLLDKHADLNRRDHKGRTALDFAIIRDDQAVESMLRQVGAKTGKELSSYPGVATK